MIWVFGLMTTGWKIGVSSQSDKGFAGETGRHEMHLYWWENATRSRARGYRSSWQRASHEHLGQQQHHLPPKTMASLCSSAGRAQSCRL